MCGIVGYIGKDQAAPILLEGLQKLEYRGYDSAGLAIMNGGKINVEKAEGRLSILDGMVQGGKTIKGTLGIGHTRWATHGKPSDINSHPHFSSNEEFAVVHNGIIENYLQIKEYLQSKGFIFVSETDTEVIAHLIEYMYKGDILEALGKALRRMEGSYAIGLLCIHDSDKLIAARKDSPLVLGLGKDGGHLASDIPALLKYTRDVYIMENDEIAVIEKDKVQFLNTDLEKIQKETHYIDWDTEAAEKGGYEHFMIKEIMEQPKAIIDTMRPRIKNGRLEIEGFDANDPAFRDVNRICIIACGSACYAGMVGRTLLEKLTRIPVETCIASEFRYGNPIVDKNTLVIIISQSGETADTLAALREAKKLGAKTFSIVNVLGSSIARESDYVIYTWAGPEIAVATTKAYSAQVCAMYMIALWYGNYLGRLTDDEVAEYCKELERLPGLVEKILENKEELQYLASLYYSVKNVFFIGRGVDYAISMEGSLKLKEISYIHSEATPAGELKHGTISLIEEGTLVIAPATESFLNEKLISNIRETKARGSHVIAVTWEGNEQMEKAVDHIYYIPKVCELFSATLAIIPLQLFAYYVAVMKGCDVDKPRNLAKSVTVE